MVANRGFDAEPCHIPVLVPRRLLRMREIAGVGCGLPRISLNRKSTRATGLALSKRGRRANWFSSVIRQVTDGSIPLPGASKSVLRPQRPLPGSGAFCISDRNSWNGVVERLTFWARVDVSLNPDQTRDFGCIWPVDGTCVAQAIGYMCSKKDKTMPISAARQMITYM